VKSLGTKVVLLSVVLTAACGGSSSASTTVPRVAESSSTEVPATLAATTTVAETSTAAVNTRYASVFDLRDLVESAGYPCNGWAIIAEPVSATERAICTDEVVLAIHANASEAQLSVDTNSEMATAFGLSSVFVIGPNWAVNCGDREDLCIEFQRVLGGEVPVASP